MKRSKAKPSQGKPAKPSGKGAEVKLILSKSLTGTGGHVALTCKTKPLPEGVKPTMLFGDDVHNVDTNTLFVWCLHCERTYRRGECRVIGGLQMCPYEHCDGDTVFDGWEWFTIRRGNPQYPVIPEPGKCYPMYP